MRRVEKQVMLETLDTRWKEHLATMDHLRMGIHLRGYMTKKIEAGIQAGSLQFIPGTIK